MKQLQILLAIAFLTSIQFVFAQDSIPNSDFESWNTGTSPQSWQTVNNLLPPGNFACYQTSNSYSADYALQLKTIDLDGLSVPGVVTLGEVGMGYTSGGIGFTSKPIALKGFYKHPSVGDEVMVFVQFFKNGVEMGGGFWSTTDSVPNYTEFNAPINYQSSEFPDTMNITIITDQYTVGSSLLIDHLTFEYAMTSISDQKEEEVSIYPNPCSTQLFMNLSGNLPTEVRIFDMMGKQVMHEPQPVKTINTASLPKGMYTVLVSFEERTFSEKLIKQ